MTERMKMRIAMIAALAAAQLSVAVPSARAADLPCAETKGPEACPSLSLASMESAGIAEAESRGLGADDSPAPATSVGDAQPSPQAAAAEQDGKKRKGTGDKVLTGVAVVLGVGALAVGGLLAAIFLD